MTEKKEAPKRTSNTEEEVPTVHTISLDALCRRVEDVASGLKDAGLNNSVGMGKKTEVVLNQLLTFLGVVEQPVDDEEDLGELERGMAPKPRTIETVKKELQVLVDLARDPDLPAQEREEVERYGNELLALLIDIIDSFEGYKSLKGLNRLLWPLNGPFLRDRVITYISKHKYVQEIQSGLTVFLKTVEGLPTGEAKEQQVIALRQKVAQHAWTELYRGMLSEAEAGKLSFRLPTQIVDSPITEKEEMTSALQHQLWSDAQTAENMTVFANLLKALNKNFSKRVVEDLKTLWDMATGNQALLSAHSVVDILVGTEEILTSLRKQNFIVILRDYYLYPKKTKRRAT